MPISHLSEHAPHAPKQSRSRQTIDRILSAARELLHEKEFGEITVAEIILRAQSSTGAFYGHFKSKEALLPALYDAYSRALRAETTVWSDPSTWGERSLRIRVSKFVTYVIRDYRETRFFMRPLALYTLQHASEISPENRQRSVEKHHASCAFLLDCRAEIRHPAPERAVDLIAYAIPAIGRAKVLFGDTPHAGAMDLSDEALIQELTHMALTYLSDASSAELVHP